MSVVPICVAAGIGISFRIIPGNNVKMESETTFIYVLFVTANVIRIQYIYRPKIMESIEPRSNFGNVKISRNRIIDNSRDFQPTIKHRLGRKSCEYISDQ